MTLEPGRRHQALVGFGASIAWYQDKLVPNAPDGAYQMLFPDLGLDILRLRNRFGRVVKNFDANFGAGRRDLQEGDRGARASAQDPAVVVDAAGDAEGEQGRGLQEQPGLHAGEGEREVRLRQVRRILARVARRLPGRRNLARLDQHPERAVVHPAVLGGLQVRADRDADVSRLRQGAGRDVQGDPQVAQAARHAGPRGAGHPPHHAGPLRPGDEHGPGGRHRAPPLREGRRTMSGTGWTRGPTATSTR